MNIFVGYLNNSMFRIVEFFDFKNKYAKLFNHQFRLRTLVQEFRISIAMKNMQKKKGSTEI
jgi:hypothetical protein